MADIRILGHEVKPWVAILGTAGGLVAAYYAYKQYKANQAGSSAASGSATDPVTGLPYSQDTAIDPLTGMTYLSEAQQYGSVQAAEAAVAGQSSLGYGYGTGTGYTGGTTYTATGTGGYASNAAWAQAATAGLTSIGYSSTDVAAALGQYLAGMPLGTGPDGTSYVSIVQAAIAEYGPPPVGSFTIIPAPATGGTGSGNAGTGSTSGPTATSPAHPMIQTGTVHSYTTGGSAPVKTVDGGYTWIYEGSKPDAAEVKAHPVQQGTVHSATTGLNAKVESTDGGYTWIYTG